MLGDPDLELSLTDIAERTDTPHPSVSREIQRVRQSGPYRASCGTENHLPLG